MIRGAVRLADWPAGRVVRVACALCRRDGRHRLADPIARSGPDTGLPEVLAGPSGDRFRRRDRRRDGPCRAHYPDLARRRAGQG